MPIAPSPPGPARIGFRWAILVLICAGTTINYIDRLVIAILAPDLQKLYHITDAQYGYIGSAFGVTYSLGRIGYALALAAWSTCAMFTALGRGALSFSLLRGILGVCESPGYPAAAKVC